MVTYEALLDNDLNWALQEADRYFAKRSLVHTSLRKVVDRFEESGVDYAIIGAVAMFFHGFRRFTQDIDILVTKSGLTTIDECLVGHGYVRPPDWRRGIRDAETGVAIHIMVAGMAAGDRTAATLTLPDPRINSIDHLGFNLLTVPRLLELKFALGHMPHARRHQGDAQAMIQHLDLPLEFAAELAPEFRDEYVEFWNYAQISKADEY